MITSLVHSVWTKLTKRLAKIQREVVNVKKEAVLSLTIGE